MIQHAKQVIGKADRVVERSDLLGGCLRTALEQKSELPVSLNRMQSMRDDDFSVRASQHEALAEPIARMLGIFGHYGNGDEVDQALESIKALSAFPFRDGEVGTIELQRYPGMLALYGYGLGALKAKRFDIIFR